MLVACSLACSNMFFLMSFADYDLILKLIQYCRGRTKKNQTINYIGTIDDNGRKAARVTYHREPN